jgi:hypothetical protein
MSIHRREMVRKNFKVERICFVMPTTDLLCIILRMKRKILGLTGNSKFETKSSMFFSGKGTYISKPKF